MPALDCISILEAGSFATDSGTVLVPSGERPFPFPIVIDVDILETAAANDNVNASAGMLLYEAANATDAYSAAGSVYEVLVFEPAAAFDDITAREPAAFDADVAEAAVATDAPDTEAEPAAEARSETIAGPRSLIMLSTDGTPRDAMVDAIMVTE